MKLLYQNTDITSLVNIRSADITSNAGGKSDSLDIKFNDSQKLWSVWKPQKNHKIELVHNGLASGIMYVDELRQSRGVFVVRALSITQDAKTENSRAWENVRFLEFAQDLSAKNGFNLKTYGIENNLYVRIDQTERSDFDFLDYRCVLEGYALKLYNGTAVIYSEKYIESQQLIKTIYANQFDGDYEFVCKSTGVYGSSKFTYGDIKYTYAPGGIFGPVLKITDVCAYNLAEAERYGKSMLRFRNKYEYTGYFTIAIDTSITAGNVINISGLGLSDGKYLITQTIHKITSKKTYIKVRKTLEGY